MLTEVLTAGAILGVTGFILGAALWFAAKTFFVEEDERIEKITACLPGANCGGCGYAGCTNYADAIVNDGAPINLCGACTPENFDNISKIVGAAASDKEKMIAFVKCRGGNNIANKKYDYHGMHDCAAAARILDGDKQCKYGCLGFGTCATVCPTGAISVIDGVAVVDKDMCIGCGACQKICPKGVIQMVPASAKVFVACSSQDKGAATRGNCASGCIGCKLCQKTCTHGAITVTNNFATIDNNICVACGDCVNKCPLHLIQMFKEPCE